MPLLRPFETSSPKREDIGLLRDQAFRSNPTTPIAAERHRFPANVLEKNTGIGENPRAQRLIQNRDRYLLF
jgi:hypothetical protein